MLSSSVSTWARAETIPDVTLEIDPCVGVKLAFVERVVAAELAGHAEGRIASVAHVECAAEGVIVTVTTARGPRRRTLRLDLEAPEARARLLGVAIVELLEASWSEPAPKPVPKPVVTPPPAPPPKVDVLPKPAPARTPWEIAVSGVGRGFRSLTLLGAGASIGYTSTRHLGVRLDADGATARAHLDLGDVDARAGSLGLAATLSAKTAAFSLESGIGVRFGLVHLSGSPNAGAVGHAITETWGGPFVSVGAGWTLVRSLSLVAGGEAGWATREAAGLVANDPRVALEHAWWSARLGLAVAL